MPEIPPDLPYDIAPLLDLKIAVFRLPLGAERDLPPLDVVPAFRSRLGRLLKQRFCPYPDYGRVSCKGCGRAADCIYTLMFAPTCSVVEPDLPGRGHCHGNPPRPYALNLHPAAGDSLHLTLIGERAIRFRRPMLESLFQASLALKPELSVTPLPWQALKPNLNAGGPSFTAIEGRDILTAAVGAPLGDWVRALPDPGFGRAASGAELMELCFTTPLQDKRLEKSLDFSAFLKSVIARLRDLKRIYHPGNDMGKFPGSFYDGAGSVRLFSSLRYQKASWFSKHRNRAITLGGLTGRLILEGDLTPYIPVLAAGFFLGLGSKTVYGLGRFSTAGWE